MKFDKNEAPPEDLIRKVRQNDEQAFHILLDMYDPLLKAAVSRHADGVSAFELEDFRQVAAVAFYRAIMSFDLAQSEVEFGLYAKICVNHALSSHLQMLRRQTEISVVEVAAEEGDNGEGDPAKRIMEEEAEALLHARIRSLLSPFENRVWNLYTAGFSAKDIGLGLGKDTHSIENAVYRIRQKLRQALGKR